ncbi:hypothetical protein [Cellulomonas sp. NPDC089187]|uniref:hypothetical protein n=1 Tax=Cellulomonas sp. NPDC089187 TaxID=3154970 RepID=UPI0034181B95
MATRERFDRVQELRDEMGGIPVDWSARSLLEGTQDAMRVMAARHPELSRASIRKLGNYFSYGWR